MMMMMMVVVMMMKGETVKPQSPLLLFFLPVIVMGLLKFVSHLFFSILFFSFSCLFLSHTVSNGGLRLTDYFRLTTIF